MEFQRQLCALMLKKYQGRYFLLLEQQIYLVIIFQNEKNYLFSPAYFKKF